MLHRMNDLAPPSAAEKAMRDLAFLRAWGLLAVFMLLLTTVNALSLDHEHAGVDPVEPFVWEYSSALTAIVLMPGVGWLARRAPPTGRWMRFAAIHVAGSLAYCALHVGGFVLIRKAIYDMFGGHYGMTGFLYEYRKDAISYALFVAVFWTAEWIARLLSQGQPAADEPSKSATLYAIRDGARTLWTPLDKIVAVTSARNYVEFHLADGVHALVRASLTKVEADLADAGLLRTHRSWLINPAYVRTLEPAKGGDYRLGLTTGLVAPLSRRFPDAVDTLRQSV